VETVYDDFQSDQSVAGNGNNLVVTFSQGRVSELKFVSDEGKAAIAANLSHKMDGDGQMGSVAGRVQAKSAM
jgi:hypothetical protein